MAQPIDTHVPSHLLPAVLRTVDAPAPAAGRQAGEAFREQQRRALERNLVGSEERQARREDTVQVDAQPLGSRTYTSDGTYERVPFDDDVSGFGPGGRHGGPAANPLFAAAVYAAAERAAFEPVNPGGSLDYTA